MFFFNYIFYRIAKLRFKRDGTDAGTAVTLVSLLQAILLEFIIQPIFSLIFTRNELALHAKQIGWFAGFIFILLLIYNYRKYDNKYDEYHNRWQGKKSFTRFYKGLLVIISFIIPIIFIVVIDRIIHKKGLL